jgi:2-keto-4-pentenoate hydratase
MTPENVREAARLLAAAHKGPQLGGLPAHCAPATFAEAAAIQVALLDALGETAGGYKLSGRTPEECVWGAILASRVWTTPASLRAAEYPMFGVEPEIAYRLDVDVGSGRTVTLEEFDRMASVVPAIEVVESRFAGYKSMPPIHRAADFNSNAGLVIGKVWSGVTTQALVDLAVEMRSGETVLASKKGSHPTGDPRLPAIAFLNSPTRPDRIPRGTILTTGSYAGLLIAKAGEPISARFDGYGTVDMTFTK